ncbi:MAG: hypothetical protein R3F60_24700 [bacterium]
MTDAAWYRDLIAHRIAGRPWICATDVVVTAATAATQLLELGASRVLAIGGSRGTGALPDPEVVPQIELGTTAPDMMSAIRAAEAALAAVPPEVQARIDAFDPAGEARVITALFSSGAPVGGRAVYGARPAAWQALEDKTVIDDFWDAAGVRRAPCAVVTPADLPRAAAALDRGAGTVWSGDSREGFNGGASYLRWVRDDAQAADAKAFFADHCDRVRLMPFLEGVPCSIHGIALPGHIVALRPCEMVVFRVPGQATFAYAAAATFWDPPAEHRDAMRAIARRVGAHLQATVAYRGAFTVDGVLTRDGFLPTELNPRYGAGLGVMAAGMPDLPLYLLHLAIAEGEPVDFRPHDLEALLLDVADRERRGMGHRLVKRPITDQRAVEVTRGADGWRPVAEGEPAQARLSLGPSPVGGFLRAVLDPSTPPSAPAAPRIAELLTWASDHWDLDVGPLEAAVDVTRG